MPLPFASLIPKPKEGEGFAKILNILFYISLSLILVFLIIFFLLNNAVQKSTKFLENQEQTLIAQRTPEQLELEKKILNFQQKIGDFNVLFNQHRFLANAFSILEKLTHSKVWFSDFQLTPQTGSIALVGEANSFQNLAEQILILKGNENIRETNLSGARINPKGNIEFNLQLTLSPDVFLYQVTETKEETKEETK